MPKRIAPELARVADRPPTGNAWLHELKLDGYRLLARKDGGEVLLLSRRGHDWSERVPWLKSALAALSCRRAWLDGELVALRDDGHSDFQALQQTLGDGCGTRCLYYAFDLLFVDDEDLMSDPLEARKRRLHALLQDADAKLRYCDHVVGSGERVFSEACRLGAEGVLSKRRDRPYRGGRHGDWLKLKCRLTQELVIVGYTRPGGARTGFGALLLGYYDGRGRLRYAGKVGTGFTEHTLKQLHARLQALESREPPVVDPPRGTQARGVHWVRPALVAQVQIAGLTQRGHVRQAAFQGLREDVPVEDVTLESAGAAGA